MHTCKGTARESGVQDSASTNIRSQSHCSQLEPAAAVVAMQVSWARGTHLFALDLFDHVGLDLVLQVMPLEVNVGA